MESTTIQKIESTFSQRKFLTEETFLQEMCPTNEMTYKEIKECIYAKELLPKDIWSPLDLKNLAFTLSNPEREGRWIKMTGKSGFSLPSFEQFNEAYYHCRTFITDAFRDSHTSCPEYKTALLIKIRSLQSALVYWRIMRDKWSLVLCCKLNISEESSKQQKGGNEIEKRMNAVRKKTINPKYSDRFQKAIEKIITYRTKHQKENIYWEEQKYSLHDLSNDIKHNEDILAEATTKMRNKDFNLEAFEKLFYNQILKNLVFAVNEYIEIINEFIALFAEHIGSCFQGDMHFFYEEDEIT